MIDILEYIEKERWDDIYMMIKDGRIKDINKYIHNGNSIFHIACVRNKIDFIKKLIKLSEDNKKLIYDGYAFLSAKDLCMIEHIDKLKKSGIISFKIEGRLRDPLYVETVSRCYKEAITQRAEHREVYKKQSGGRGKLADIVFTIEPAEEG